MTVDVFQKDGTNKPSFTTQLRQISLAVAVSASGILGASEKMNAANFSGYATVIEQDLRYGRVSTQTMKLAEELISLHPVGESYVLRGRTRLAFGDRDAALQDAKQALMLAPRSRAALFFLTESFSALDRYGDAIGIISWYVRSHPTDTEGLELMGRCLQNAGRYHEAITVYERAISLGYTDGSIETNLLTARRVALEQDTSIRELSPEEMAAYRQKDKKTPKAPKKPKKRSS